MESNKFLKLFGLIFGLVGILVLCVGSVFLYLSIREVPGERTITAVISDIQRVKSNKKYNHHVYVDYEFNGVKYSHASINTYSSSMYVGKEITLQIDPDNPDQPYDKGAYFIGVIVCGIIGLIFAGLGITIFVKAVKSIKAMKYLLSNGKKVMCLVTEIKLGNSSVNKVRAKIVKCVSDDGTYSDFTSQNIYLKDEMMPAIGDYVCVYVDRNNSKNYFVDIK